MEEMIGGAFVKGTLLNVLTENADTHLVTTSKETCTRVMMNVFRRMFVGVLVLLRHVILLEGVRQPRGRPIVSFALGSIMLIRGIVASVPFAQPF
jgi:hypothetical protein